MGGLVYGGVGWPVMVAIAYYLEDHPSQWFTIMVRRFDPLKNRLVLDRGCSTPKWPKQKMAAYQIGGPDPWDSIQVLPSFLSWSNLLGWNQIRGSNSRVSKSAPESPRVTFCDLSRAPVDGAWKRGSFLGKGIKETCDFTIGFRVFQVSRKLHTHIFI